MTDHPNWAYAIDVLAKLTTGAAGVVISYMLYRLNHRQHQIEREQSLDIKMLTDLSSRKGGVVVHVQVEMKNISKDRWCIPAVYLDAAVIPPDMSYVKEDEFIYLPPADVHTPGNLAFVRDSVKHLSPDEVETVTCTLQFTPEQVATNQVLMLRARIFGADGKVLGPLYGPESMRNEWIEFAQENDSERTDFCFLRRLAIDNETASKGLRPNELSTLKRVAGLGRWVILSPPSPGTKLTPATEDQLTPDVASTDRFAPVLRRIFKWSQYKVVNLTRTPDLTIAQVAVNPTGHGGHQPS